MQKFNKKGQKNPYKTIEQTLDSMLKENTGVHMLDSGGDNGRAWQRNQDKNFEIEPVVDWGLNDDATDSSDIDIVVSTYHHLKNSLELDDLCDQFNRKKCLDWDSDKAYGISKRQEEWLLINGFAFGSSWNSYNGDSNLSQTLQGCNMHLTGNESNFEYPEYVLLQIHNGADVRGGYTNAKLFRVKEEYFDVNPVVFGTIDGVEVETSYDGNTVRNSETYDVVPVTKDSRIELYLV